jgi:hypothetical protein
LGQEEKHQESGESHSGTPRVSVSWASQCHETIILPLSEHSTEYPVILMCG